MIGIARGVARRLPAVALGLAVAAGLAGCGGGGDATRGGVLGVGAVLPLSGPDGRTGEQILMGLELACDEAGPGPLATVREVDGLGKPLESVRAYRELASDPDIRVVVGGWFASTARSIAAVGATASGNAQGLPFLALSPLTSGREGVVTCFPLHRIEALARGAALFAREDLGARRAGVARAPGSEVARLLGDAFVAEFPRAGERIAWDLTAGEDGSLTLPPGPEPRVDVVYVAGPGSLATEVSGLSARTRAAALLTADGWTRTGLMELAEEGVAIYLVSAFSETDPSPANRKLLEACARAGRDPNPALALGWDAGRLARHAASRGGPTREGMLASLREGAPFAGSTGRIELSAGGPGAETPSVSSFGRAGVVFLKRVEVGGGPEAGGG